MKNSRTETNNNVVENGNGEISDPPPRDVRFEVTEKGLDFWATRPEKSSWQSRQERLGRHDTVYLSTVLRLLRKQALEFGDTINLDVNTTLLSAIQREGLTVPLNLEYSDLHVHQCDYQSSCATVVMLDCSHSMILYGEDRFLRLRKWRLLWPTIRTQYPGDSLKVVLFHDSAEELPLGKLAVTRLGLTTQTPLRIATIASVIAGPTERDEADCDGD
jgi:Ca-activated chloride channel family protein